VLTGECADELFGGYPWYKDPKLLQMDKFPWDVFHVNENLLNAEWKEKLQCGQYQRTIYKNLVSEMPRLEGETTEAASMRELFWVNITVWMVTLLRRQDALSMHHGVEARVPYADEALMQYVWNVPMEMKMQNNVEKTLLRKAVEHGKHLPDEVCNRKKCSYPVSKHPHVASIYANEIQKIIEANTAPWLKIFDIKKLQELISDPTANKLQMSFLLQIDFWFKEYKVELDDDLLKK